jgi:hypothetical protein
MARRRTDTEIPDCVWVEVFSYLKYHEGGAVRRCSNAFKMCAEMTPIRDRRCIHDLEAWKKCFPKSKHLTVSSPKGAIDLTNLESFQATFVTCPMTIMTPHHLNELTIHCHPESSMGDEFMQLLSGIKKVSLENVLRSRNLTVHGFEYLRGVQELKITSSDYFTHFPAIASLPYLCCLTLSFSNPFKDRMFTELKHLPLKVLKMTGYSDDRARLTDQAFTDTAGIEVVELASAKHDFLLSITTMGFQTLGGKQSFEVMNTVYGYGLRFCRYPGKDNSSKSWKTMRLRSGFFF